MRALLRRGLDAKWRPLWCGAKGYAAGGWTAFVLGNALRFSAMRFGAQTVLAALTSAQFVIIPAASYWLLGEAVTASSLVGVVIILIGAPAAASYSVTKVGMLAPCSMKRPTPAFVLEGVHEEIGCTQM